MTYLLYQLYIQKISHPEKSGLDNYSNKEKKSLEKLLQGDFVPLASQNCVDHPEIPAAGICCLSDEAYCELCLAKENDLKFARKYLGLVLDNTWEDILVVRNEGVGSKKLQEFYQSKKYLWQEFGTPVIAQKQFKINIENDKIEAYTMIKCRPEDKDQVKTSIKTIQLEG